jgi:hypothetical protein
MAGLVPAIHVLVGPMKKDVDARHKAGHDGAFNNNRHLTRFSMAKLICPSR